MQTAHSVVLKTECGTDLLDFFYPARKFFDTSMPVVLDIANVIHHLILPVMKGGRGLHVSRLGHNIAHLDYMTCIVC